jgi:hypothetical protein
MPAMFVNKHHNGSLHFTAAKPLVIPVAHHTRNFLQKLI